MDPDTKLTPRDDRLKTHADAADRAMRLWTARVAGATWQQAADMVGFTDTANAMRCVRNYFGSLPEVHPQDRRDLWRERLEVLWRQTVKDAAQQRPGAVRAGVAVAQRAAQLDGLDEPSRSVVITPSAEQIERYVESVVAMRHADDPVEGDIMDDDE